MSGPAYFCHQDIKGVFDYPSQQTDPKLNLCRVYLSYGTCHICVMIVCTVHNAHVWPNIVEYCCPGNFLVLSLFYVVTFEVNCTKSILLKIMLNKFYLMPKGCMRAMGPMLHRGISADLLQLIMFVR